MIVPGTPVMSKENIAANLLQTVESIRGRDGPKHPFMDKILGNCLPGLESAVGQAFQRDRVPGGDEHE